MRKKKTTQIFNDGTIPILDKRQGVLTKYDKTKVKKLTDKIIGKRANQFKWDFPKPGQADTTHTLRIFVPSTNGKQQQIPDKAFRERVAKVFAFLSSIFGGGTQFVGYGNFKSKGKNIAEPMGIVESSTTDEDWKKYDKTVLSFIRKQRSAWKQISITFWMDGKFYFVSANRKW